MPPLSAHLRRATPADVEAVAAVHVRSWQAAYAGLLPAAGLADLSIPARAEQWRRWLTDPGRTECWVATERGAVVGFASLGPARDAASTPWCGEVFAIYLLPEAIGRGLGRAVWAQAIDRLAATGHRSTGVWVLSGNARARSFYARQGLAEDGATHTVAIFGAPQPEIRMSGALPALPFASGLAAALDAGDRTAALRFLAPECRFAGPTGEQVGAEATLTSLQQTESVLFASLEEAKVQRTVEALGGDRFRVKVSGRLRHGGHAHTWRAQETLSIPPELGVVRIVAHDPERPRLLTFLQRAGVSI